MTRKRPYTETDSPREWARKKILDLEEMVAGLKTRLDEQGALIDALRAQRPSRFIQSNSTGIDWWETAERERSVSKPGTVWVPGVLGREPG